MKRCLKRLYRWQYLGLCLLVLITLIMHFSVIMRPAEANFDEQHYVPDAQSIIAGEGTLREEHLSARTQKGVTRRGVLSWLLLKRCRRIAVLFSEPNVHWEVDQRVVWRIVS